MREPRADPSLPRNRKHTPKGVNRPSLDSRTSGISDGSGLGEAGQIGVIEADFGVDLGVVFREAGREGNEARLGAGEFQRIAVKDDLSEAGMGVTFDHSAGEKLRIVREPTTQRGFRAWITSGARPWPASQPERKFSTTASALSTRRRKISRPSGTRTSRVMERLPRFVFWKESEVSPSGDGPRHDAGEVENADPLENAPGHGGAA